jgi:anti-sigma B factor antagonist
MQARPVPSLQTVVREQVRQGRLVVLLDMTAVTDIDAHGLGALVSGLTTLERHGGQMALVAPPDRIRRLLAITRLDTVFAIYDSEAEALMRYPQMVASTESWADCAVGLDENRQSEAAASGR